MLVVQVELMEIMVEPLQLVVLMVLLEVVVLVVLVQVVVLVLVVLVLNYQQLSNQISLV